MICLKNITLAYGSRVLLQDVCASFAAGTLTALAGRNGTGKSTLLRVVAGLQQAGDQQRESAAGGGKVARVAVGGEIGGAAGLVELNGRPLSGLSSSERAKMVSFVTTEKVRIANLACEDVVALGRAPYTNWIGRMQRVDRQAVHDALETVGMSDFARKTMDRMSDGECQRVMIARALAQDTPIVLLDEPTAFLDLPNRYQIAMLLRRLAHQQGKCVLFSTHDLDIALRLCDTVALIDTPRLHSLPAAEMAASGHIERLFAGTGITFDAATQTIAIGRQ